MSRGARAAIGAWLITAMYYFYQYTLRSAPAVMMPQLSEAFGLGVIGTASLAGLFYYGYSPFSLVAGAAMDRLGPRRVVPLARRSSASARCSSRRAAERRRRSDGSCRAPAACSRWSAPPTSRRRTFPPHAPRR